MPRLIFLNLPVADLPRATAFYEAIGARKNPKFSDDSGACMVLSDVIHVMLLTHDKYSQFTPKRIADAHQSSAVLIAISEDSRDDVDRITEAAIAAGGREAHPPEDYGFMYSRAFEDPDGNGWGPFWMDPVAAEQGPAAFAAEEAAS